MGDYTNPMRRFSWYRSLIVILAITLLLGFYPAGSATAQTPVMPIYIVKPNDTLYDIAVKFRTSVDAIMSANGRTNADTLSIDRVRAFGRYAHFSQPQGTDLSCQSGDLEPSHLSRGALYRA